MSNFDEVDSGLMASEERVPGNNAERSNFAVNSTVLAAACVGVNTFNMGTVRDSANLVVNSVWMTPSTVYPSGSSEQDCIELIEDVIFTMRKAYLRNELQQRRRPNRHAPTMLRVVNEVSQKHEMLFNGMINKLQTEITESNVAEVFRRVAEQVLIDGQNWGRIMVIIAFSGWLARYYSILGMTDSVDQLTQSAGEFIVRRCISWIKANGGWNAFDEFFRKPEAVENQLWRGLLYTVVGLGVTVAATVIAVK